ncbi:Fpr2p [Saccharomyces cerevisiae x Saccharomyces kudriavzevii VIN7]|uniref:peptidylprolyl isomerase n=1 Tax=Saccharomyces cerevisiae x Saccharomyces kudriavzevii (strain VIN7) TaxID=1095631 RepID=H0GTJ0_SACCK|nr:Fpr2p [Saccharomyces cerevisiae x Saccharomyces kudriavzevii VIN7]
MLLNIYLLFTFFATGLAGSLTDLEIGVTKRIPVEECVIKAMPGDKVEVHYTGSLLESGTVFDSSYSRGSPIAFELGVGRVIKGWDQGIAGMCIGEKGNYKFQVHWPMVKEEFKVSFLQALIWCLMLNW